MSHISESILRRMIDEPGILLSYEKEHLLGCAQCSAASERIRVNAAFAATQLAAAGDIRVEGAMHNILARSSSRALPAPAAFRPRLSPPATRWMASAAAAIALFVLFAYTPVRGYAENLLAIFEPHQFTPVGLSTADLNSMQGLPDLGAFGTMNHSRDAGKVQDYADAVTAARFAHQAIVHPRFLPPGVPNTARYFVSQAHTMSFTFNAAKARATAAHTGKRILEMPANIDGSTLAATVGPIVVQWYGTNSATQNHLRRSMHTRSKHDFLANMPHDMIVVSQAPAPRVYSTGATVVQIESYLLAQPDLPANLVRQIRAIGDPSTTVPVPFPMDKANAQNVNVNGANALLIGDNTGVGSAIIWTRNGVVYGVAGPYTAAQIVQVANGLSL